MVTSACLLMESMSSQEDNLSPSKSPRIRIHRVHRLTKNQNVTIPLVNNLVILLMTLLMLLPPLREVIR